jgi:hypothetical protein
MVSVDVIPIFILLMSMIQGSGIKCKFGKFSSITYGCVG